MHEFATPRRPPRRYGRPSRRCATPSRISADCSRARASSTTIWRLRCERFDARIAAEITRREEAESRADAAGRLEQLLDGRSLDELAAVAADAASAFDAHVADHGARPGGRPDRAATEQAVAAREQVIEQLADLRARIEEREAGMDDTAELELRLEQASSERARLVARPATRRAWRARSWLPPHARHTSGSRRT